MSSAGLVYINNPKFGPELNGKILSNNTPCQIANTGTFYCFFAEQELLLTVFEQVNSVLTCPRAAN